jgi:NitT/TauT family transport system substrate-binding protein
VKANGDPSRRVLFRLAIALALAISAPARAEVNEVRLGVQFGFIYLPIVIADSEGFIQKRARELGAGDLKVTLQRFSGTPAMNEAMLSGNVDFGALGLPGLLIVWEKTNGRQNIKGLLGMPLTAFALYTNKPAVKSVADFGADDRIALPATNSGQGILLRMAMEQTYGPGEYKRADALMVNLPHPDAVAALLSGTIAGYFSAPPYAQFLAKDGRVHVVATSRQIFGGFEASGSGLSGSQKFFDANPLVSRAVFLGIEDANRLINDNPARAAELYLQAEKSSLSPQEVQAILRDGTNIFQIEPRGTMAFATFMARTGMLQSAPQSWKDVFFPLIHDREGS